MPLRFLTRETTFPIPAIQTVSLQIFCRQHLRRCSSTMSIGRTCEAITVSEHGVLECRTQREDGTWENTLFNLNKYIGNDNGESINVPCGYIP